MDGRIRKSARSPYSWSKLDAEIGGVDWACRPREKSTRSLELFGGVSTYLLLRKSEATTLAR